MLLALVRYTQLAIVCIVLYLGNATALAQAVRPETVATGLQNPWAVAFLPDGRFLVTERPGRMRVIDANGKLLPPVTGLPSVAAGGQGGLLDLLLDADFMTNRTLFFCFSEPGSGGPSGGPSAANSTALARARLSNDATRLEDVKIIFSQHPKVASNLHFGCRIVESRTDDKPDGLLFLTLGDRYTRKDDAQTLDNHHGKVVRIGKDGGVPASNPFSGAPNGASNTTSNPAVAAPARALPEIWSYGHRNLQGAALAPDGTLWTTEHVRKAATRSTCPGPA